jgi:DNA-binding GntR family transcriptional regulator
VRGEGIRVRRRVEMSYLLESLTRKEDVDKLILNTIDKVLVLRIGRASDVVCMQLDEIVSALSLLLGIDCLVLLCDGVASCYVEDFYVLPVFWSGT